MRNVLSIIHYPVFGGPHNSNLQISKILKKKGVRLIVLLPDEPGNAAQRLRAAGVETVQIPLRRIRSLHNLRANLANLWEFRANLRSIRKVITEYRIDVVQLNGLVNAQGAIAAHGCGVPVVWQIVDTFTPTALRRMMAPVVRHYGNVVMCVGQRVADLHPGLTRRPVHLLNFYPPVDTERFRPDPSVRRMVREELGLGAASLVVGTIGNVNYLKGHDNFIRAASILRRRIPDARFVIIGVRHPNHRDYWRWLCRLASDLDLEIGRHLLVIDGKNRVMELAQGMDVFWMTSRSRSEGIPTAMEEAMSLELPVVSFKVGSIGELVQHGQSG